MKKSIFLCLGLIAVLLSCQNNEKNGSSNGKTDSVGSQTKVEVYKNFLAELDKTTVESSVPAAKKFQELFAGQSPTICDTGYAVFLDFYTLLEVEINKQLENDNQGYDSLLMNFGPGVKVKLSPRLLKFNEQLTSNGFRLEWEEGITYIVKDGDFVNKWMLPSLSPAMKEYLGQENKEDKAGFAMDGGIVISYQELADRMVWWERFTKNNPDFIFSSNCKSIKERYWRAILTGMDNTPLMDYEDPSKMTSYFSDLYEYLLSNYPETEASVKIKPYYSALKQKDEKEAKRLLEEYQKELNR